MNDAELAEPVRGAQSDAEFDEWNAPVLLLFTNEAADGTFPGGAAPGGSASLATAGGGGMCPPMLLNDVTEEEREMEERWTPEALLDPSVAAAASAPLLPPPPRWSKVCSCASARSAAASARSAMLASLAERPGDERTCGELGGRVGDGGAAMPLPARLEPDATRRGGPPPPPPPAPLEAAAAASAVADPPSPKVLSELELPLLRILPKELELSLRRGGTGEWLASENAPPPPGAADGASEA